MYRIARGLRARGGHGLCGILVLSLGPFLAGLELLHAQAQVIGEPDTKAGDSSLQLRGAEPPQLVTTAQRLMMEQIEDLIQAGESQEAIQILDKVFDQGQSRVVPVGKVQSAGTLHVQRYIPLRFWSRLRLVRLLNRAPELRENYERQWSAQAVTAFESCNSSKDTVETSQAMERYFATAQGPRLGLLLSDLYLERGWSIAAVQAVLALPRHKNLPGAACRLCWQMSHRARLRPLVKH